MKRMTTILRSATLIAAVLGVTLFSACNPDKQKFVLNASQTAIAAGDVINFTTTFDGSDVTSSAVITETESGTEVVDATWTTDAAGTYTFRATYNGVSSNIITIEVAEFVEGMPITFAPTFASSVKVQPADIGVFASMTGQKVFDDESTANLLYNQMVENENGDWVYDPEQNWTGGNNSFFAYAPYASSENGITISAESATGAPVLTYKLLSGDNCHTDIMIATPAMNLKASEQAVTMEFRSIMSRIGFRIKGQGEQISKIAVRGILEGGSIALNAVDQGTSTWTREGEITLNEFKAGLTFDNGENYVTATETMTNVTAADGYLYLMPQNVNYQARIVVAVDGKDFGFPFESVLQMMPGMEYIIDLNIPSDKPLDWTDNASPALFIAALDGAAAENVSWFDAMDGCDEGYRLPTFNEGLLVMLYMNGIASNNFRYASYWTSTQSKENDWAGNPQSLFYDSYRNVVGPTTQTGLTAFRCIKEAPAGVKYPYVDTSDPNGPIIVSRDANGGVNPSAISLYDVEYFVFHDNWTTTPEHTTTGAGNYISRKLQVANADLSEEMVVLADFVCTDGWRTPTMRELLLIYAVGGGLATSYDNSTTSVYYNPVAIETPLYNVAGFTPMIGDFYWVASLVAGRSPSPMGVSMLDASTKVTAASLPFYARCVRDIE